MDGMGRAERTLARFFSRLSEPAVLYCSTHKDKIPMGELQKRLEKHSKLPARTCYSL